MSLLHGGPSRMVDRASMLTVSANVLHGFSKNSNWRFRHQISSAEDGLVACRSCCSPGVETARLRIPSISTCVGLEFFRNGSKTKVERVAIIPVMCAVDEDQGYLEDEDDELCPVECVKEFKTDEEFIRILEKAKETKALVVVDFFRTSCGSCKYIEQGFSKLCKGAGEDGAPVIFLKHNVIDEYDERSEVADRLRIRTVPLFHFYKDGVLVESFATRDKERIDETIRRYTYPSSQEG